MSVASYPDSRRTVARRLLSLMLLALALPVLPSLVPPRLSRRRACRLAGGVAGGGLAGRLLPCAAAAPELPTWSWIEVPGVGPVRRRYALLTLSNGLRCIVASDEASSRLELAATVSSGSLDDPADLEGLAHLAEHVTLASDTAGFTNWADAREGDVRRQHPAAALPALPPVPSAALITPPCRPRRSMASRASGRRPSTAASRSAATCGVARPRPRPRARSCSRHPTTCARDAGASVRSSRARRWRCPW